MKYLTEYRDPELAQRFLQEIKTSVTRPWTIMEVCGGQTHSLVKNGILDMLPKEINMVHGPGCPVCVTSVGLIDKAVDLARRDDVILCSFGDMLRVPGSAESLLDVKATGADVRVLYSPLEAVKIAGENPGKQVIFFAVGFETTAPANALSVIHAARRGLENYSILASHVLVPPAIEALMTDPVCKVEAFLAAGHVCTIMGMKEYYPLVDRYEVPIIITGFEPVDLLQGILMAVRQLEKGEWRLENQYTRMVKEKGNPTAVETIYEVFVKADQQWRGIDLIPKSGLQVRGKYREFDAIWKFSLAHNEVPENPECISGDIMKGIKKPFDCPSFGKKCTPEFPIGAPMVSSEGSCAAYYHFSGAANA